MSAFLEFGGRGVVVTGGARGIGLAIVRLLREYNVEVHVFDREPSAELEATGAVFHAVDIADAASVNAVFADLPATVTMLVNNAGITRDRSLQKMSDDEWQSVIDVNLTGTFNTIRAIAARQREAGVGRIVNITSINGIRGKFGQANYTAAKAGMIGLTKTAARELGSRGVTVNAVAPGMVMTDMAAQLPQEVLDRALAETLLNALAKPQDIANAVAFLLSDAARMITGEVIRVDAGQYI